MRTLLSAVSLVTFAGGLAACSSPEQISDEVGVAPTQTPASPETSQEKLARLVPANADPVDFKDVEKDGEAEREFEYARPAQVSAIPALVESLTADRDKKLSEQKAEWAQARSDCPPDAFSCARRAFSVEWQVITDLPRFLSLSSGHYIYGGGAHGNYWTDTLVWDREAAGGEGASMAPLDMFASTQTMWEALGLAYCDALNAERAKRRGEYYEPEATGWPNDCPQVDDLVVMLGSSNGAAFDRIGIYAAPYTAGPYAEGAYEITLPVTEEVIATVKPEYAKYFNVS
ncbi:MAG: hypothetical protein SXU28_06560 [Pseudomonadota bacterium]|nr:hypothetical protein [Pseudomonadota bacterium]